ncbi:MAG: phosphatidate cytidylyltransferase [Deltaproteobacteria bacterium]
MLRDRVITAIVIIAILVPLFLFGGVLGVAFLVTALGGTAVWELARCLPALKKSPGKEITLVLGFGIIATFYSFSLGTLMAVLAWYPLLVILIHLILYHKIEQTLESASEMIFALAYVIVPLSHAILVRRLDLGIAWIFFIMVVVCFGDVGAYFGGRFFGKHRFSKSISPSKTVEGLGGSLLGNLVGMLGVKLAFPGLPSLWYLLVVTLMLAVAGPVGDLTASMIKRRLAIKDFGTIMPGHGGVLDRADSLILAFPATFYFLFLVGY